MVRTTQLSIFYRVRLRYRARVLHALMNRPIATSRTRLPFKRCRQGQLIVGCKTSLRGFAPQENTNTFTVLMIDTVRSCPHVRKPCVWWSALS
mmetsp:Transcript_28296/g.96337  ORF Transcript_28296/g.96337 Transcript_28296/m.96337 type:complete len:93 (-) Transcript_28296:522-800(-)